MCQPPPAPSAEGRAPPRALATASSSSLSDGDRDGTNPKSAEPWGEEELAQPPPQPPIDPREVLRRGSRLASASAGLLFAAHSLSMPHQQAARDRLGCDAACSGSLASGRSFLRLVGSAAVGRLSDAAAARRTGASGARWSARTAFLWIGLASAGLSLVASRRAESVAGLWRGLLPEALEQNLPLFRAHVSEYQSLPGITAEDRAAASGSLGLAIGAAMMAGPLVGAHLTHGQAVGLGLALLCAAAASVALLPASPSPAPNTAASASARKAARQQPAGRGPWRWLDVPSARSPPALFLIVSRLLSATAYHVYQTILAPSLRERFRFTPAEYGSFFAFVGLFFALSQGVLARLCLRHLNGGGERSDLSTARQHRRRSRLLVACSAAVAAGRYAGYRSRTVAGLRAAFAVMASAYGVLSAVVAADAAQVAGPGEAGSFFGLLASVESGAGMAGPLLGGALASFSRRGGGGGGDGFDAALWAVLVLNGLGTLLIALGYERIVLRNLRPADGEQLSRHAKQH